MVEKKAIAHLGDLIKVELDKPEKYITQVEEILDYFDKLDETEYNSTKTMRKEVSFENLREDRHEQFLVDGNPLIEKLKKDSNNYVRAPKMI